MRSCSEHPGGWTAVARRDVVPNASDLVDDERTELAEEVRAFRVVVCNLLSAVQQ